MKYKKTPIPYKIDNFEYDVTNILVNVDVSQINEDYLRQYILSGETAMEASLILYDSSEYYWILYLLNGIVNPYLDWHMDNTTLKRYVEYKYGYDIINNVHHFYDIETQQRLGFKLSKDMHYLIDNSLPLPKNVGVSTNYDFEFDENEKKKVIQAVRKENLLDFINVYNDRLKLL